MARVSAFLHLAFCLALTATALSPDEARAQIEAKLQVGVALPLEGPMAPFSEQILSGMNVALDELRRDDPKTGALISLVKADDGGLSEQADKVARQLIQQKRVHVLVGSLTSAATKALARAASELKRPLVIPVTTDPDATGAGPSVFRSCLDDRQFGAALGRFAREVLKKKKAVIVEREGSSYASNVGGAFKKTFVQGGAKIVKTVAYSVDVTDFTETLKQVADADVVLLPSHYPDVPRILKTAAQMGLKVPMLGADSWDSGALDELAGQAAAQGHYFATHFLASDPNPEAVAFVNAYKARTKKGPTALAAMGYDSMKLIIDAYVRANSNRPAALIRELATTEKAQGLTGPFAISTDRDAVKTAVIAKTTADGPQFLARLAPIK